MKHSLTILAAAALGLNLGATPTLAMSDAEKGAAALALLGLAALAHHKHHYGDGYNPSGAEETAEFERGYRDGVHGYAYNTHNSTRDYAQGYQAGDRERENSMAHRQVAHSARPPRASINGCAGIVSQNFAVGIRDVHITKWREEVGSTWLIEASVGNQYMICRMDEAGSVMDLRGGERL